MDEKAPSADAKKDSLLPDMSILKNPTFVYVLIVAFFIFYLVSGIWLFGLLVGICIFWVVALEFFSGTKQHGWKNELKETAIALGLALLLWFGAGFVLQTPSPLNAIVSCSMLPQVQRGDMVVLRGDRIEAPTEKVESIAGVGSAEVYEDGKLAMIAKGSIYSYCAMRQSNELCKRFVSRPQGFVEKSGPLTIGYDKCGIYFPKSGSTQYGPCVSYLEVNGRRYAENLSNDVVVYQPNKDEYYSRVGDIIHRAFIKLQTPDGKEYFLTKGDNNPIFDIQVYDEVKQMGNNPVEVERSKGRILFALPYVGYLKLFISPSAIPTPEGCDRYFEKYKT
ncbi:MAG: hypothetical protein QW568_02820 [Candidatus Anstonellaceae archaeon]